PVTMTATFWFDGFYATKSYDFIVKTSPRHMVSRDIIYLELENDEVTEDFTLPLAGSIYQSTDITWESDSSFITISGSLATVTRPTYEVGDALVTLTATLKNETYTATKRFYITVKCLPSDGDAVEKIAGKLNFNSISVENIDNVTNNLSLQQDFGDGIICEWISSKPEIINPLTGEVTNPPIGAAPVDVTLTATVKKGLYESAPIVFNITVIPFANEAEILRKAKNALCFGEISTEDIGSVKNNLTLPLNWKYNTTITWKSSDDSAIEIIGNNSNYSTGQVKKNSLGGGLKIAELQAEIAYGSSTTTKSFQITIAENNGWYTYYFEDFESYSAQTSPYNSTAKWGMALTSQANHWVIVDPKDSSNKVLMINKPAAINRPDTYPATSMFLNNASMTGECKISFNMLMDENTQKPFYFEPYGVLEATFDGETGTVKFANVVVNTHFQKDKWTSVEFLLNIDTKEAYLYLDGICDQTEPYQFGESVTSLGGLRMRSSQATSDTDTVTYMDDLEFSAYITEYDKTLLDYIRDFEAELMLKNNLSSLSHDIRFPSSQITTTYSSADASILSNEGYIKGVGQTILYITYSNSTGSITKPYLVNISYNDEGKVTNEAMAAADIDYIMSRHNFNSLTGNINISQTLYGSMVSISSNNLAVISDSGIVRRQAGDTLVTITLIAKNGESIVSKTLSAVVKGTGEYNTAAVNGGGGGGGFAVNYGYTENKKTGIAVAPPVDIKQGFDDVNESHWAYKDIMLLTEHGIIDSDGKNFSPSKNVTRAEVAKAIVIALGYEVKDYGDEFDDVSHNSEYYDYISTARHFGIVYGEGDNIFGVDTDITRQDICVIIDRAAGVLINSIKDEYNMKFADVQDISGYAYQSVHSLMRKGLVCGNELAEFNPKNNCTRAEFCSIISRMLGGIQ
ncbi:MAG: S-layer homology domain-containing protein, partial [Firmicutes bacterium]|nr:S-layer homology domain-containing protein [Bacillota bacterium]